MWYQELQDKEILIIDQFSSIPKVEQKKFIEILKYRKISTFLLPKECVIIITCDDIQNISEEELYEKILEEQKQNPNQKKKEPHVSHESWKKTRKQKDQDLKENKKLEESKCSMMSADELFQKARKEKLENLKKLKKSLIEQSLSINPNQNARNRSVGSLDGETNLVNWRKLLVDACHIDSDWTYQNATIEYGVLTPQREELPMPLVEILLDTSESIQDKLFRNFLRECMGILH